MLNLQQRLDQHGSPGSKLDRQTALDMLAKQLETTNKKTPSQPNKLNNNNPVEDAMFIDVPGRSSDQGASNSAAGRQSISLPGLSKQPCFRCESSPASPASPGLPNSPASPTRSTSPSTTPSTSPCGSQHSSSSSTSSDQSSEKCPDAPTTPDLVIRDQCDNGNDAVTPPLSPFVPPIWTELPNHPVQRPAGDGAEMESPASPTPPETSTPPNTPPLEIPITSRAYSDDHEEIDFVDPTLLTNISNITPLENSQIVLPQGINFTPLQTQHCAQVRFYCCFMYL